MALQTVLPQCNLPAQGQAGDLVLSPQKFRGRHEAAFCYGMARLISAFPACLCAVSGHSSGPRARGQRKHAD